MRPQDFARLVALGAMWGASYLFMRYAVPHLGPEMMIELRLVLGGGALAMWLYATGGQSGWRTHWRGFLFVGVVGTAIPFLLIATALKSIDASTAAILNALVPLFTTLVAAAWIREPVTPAKAAGIATCLAGTAVLVGWTPAPMSPTQLAAAGMSITATALYGLSIVFSRVHLRGASPTGTSAATLLAGAVALLPFTPLDRNYAAAPAMAWIALAGLAIVSTTVAFILFYRLIADIGPVKASTVTLLVPIFGMIWGVILLGEPLTPGRVAGCAIILAGCSMILGLLRLPARPSAG